MGQVVLVSENVVTYLNNLVQVLYEDGYFSYKDSAKDYANKIYDFIYQELPTNAQHETPAELKSYGNYYAKFKSNKRTMWYVFFNKMKGRYFVEFVTNNYSKQSAYFNKL